jgi:transcriptional/translational regulatory protein YebC/TACO1
VQEALAKNNITTETAEITMVAKMNVDVDAETARKITKLLVNLDDHDDVQNVHCNVHMSTEVLAELENE